MKKLLVSLVLGAVLLIPMAALADTEACAAATLTLADVIDITIDATGLEDKSITQVGHLDIWNNVAAGWVGFGSFTVEVLTLTAYDIGISCYSKEWWRGATSQGQLTDDPLHMSSIIYSGLVDNYVGSIGATGLNPDFSNANNVGNIPVPGESMTYELFVDPSRLTEDFIAGDTVVFTITILVTDNTT